MQVQMRADISDEQARFAGCSDPRILLTVGTTYVVERVEVHSWHTKYFLVGFVQPFNSVCFTVVR